MGPYLFTSAILVGFFGFGAIYWSNGAGRSECDIDRTPDSRSSAIATCDAAAPPVLAPDSCASCSA